MIGFSLDIPLPQDDALFPNLTVRETLLFAARVRLPGAVGRGARDALARGVLQHLGLAKAADTLVGGPLQRGVSGGERKRVSIGAWRSEVANVGGGGGEGGGEAAAGHARGRTWSARHAPEKPVRGCCASCRRGAAVKSEHPVCR